MSDAQKLKDFFVGIGFKVDSVSQSKADAAIKATEDKATKEAAKASDKRRKLDETEGAKREKARKDAAKKEQEAQTKSLKGMEIFALKAAGFATKAFATIEASALGVVFAVDKAAKSFERMNYVGARAGATPGKVGAFGYAASQLGSSKEEAEGQLQAFGQNLKTNASGYSRALERIGVKTRDTNGHLRDSVDLATDLGDALRKMSTRGQYGYANAMNQARVFGFDGDAARAMMNPEFRKRAGEFGADKSKIGADPDGAAKSGLAFEQSMRRLNEVLEQIGTKISGVLFEKLKPLLDKLSEWFLANGDRIADIVSRIADDLVKLAAAIGEQLAGADWNSILEDFEKMAKGLGAILGKLAGEKGLVAMIAALAVGLRGLSLLAMPPWLLLLLGAGAAGAAAGAAASPLKAGENPVEHNASQLGGGVSGNGIIDKAYRGYDWTKRKLGYGTPTGNDALKMRGRSVRKGGGKAGPDGVPYKATSLTEAMGLSPAEYDAYREGVTDIEGKTYNHMGGGGGRYAGRYQMGPSEITETARRLGVARPSNEQFLKDPAMQERFFENYTLDHYKTLMQNPKFASMSKREKLQLLGYAHNQGTGSPRRGGGAWGYLETGRAGHDGFGTSGEAYFGPIGRRFDKAQPVKTPPMLKARPLPAAPPSTGPGGAPLGADGKPVTLAPSPNSIRGDTIVNHNQAFNITGGDANSNMAAARLQASRGQQDLLRNVQGTLA